MSIGTEFKQYSEIAAEQGRLALAGVRSYVFAAVGAGDAVVTRATEQGRQLAARTQEIATGRVVPTAVVADVGKAVGSYLQTAGEQAVTAYVQLSKRGEEVVHEFGKDPRVQRVIFRAERAVDTVEDTLEDMLDEIDSDVTDAKDAVAAGAEKSRGRLGKSATRNTNAAKSTTRTPPVRKAADRSAGGKAPAAKAAGRKAGRKAPAAKAASKS